MEAFRSYLYSQEVVWSCGVDVPGRGGCRELVLDIDREVVRLTGGDLGYDGIVSEIVAWVVCVSCAHLAVGTMNIFCTRLYFKPRIGPAANVVEGRVAPLGWSVRKVEVETHEDVIS